MNGFSNANGRVLVEAMIETIRSHSVWLSELDGAIGDGDHGINMNKGFQLCAQRLSAGPWTLAEGLEVLGRVLMDEVGGAMGPLYGTAFLRMAEEAHGHEIVDATVFGAMLHSALNAMRDLGGAEVGDKTLIDVMDPAAKAFSAAVVQKRDFFAALVALSVAAEAGKDSTKELVARIGRASRLGERSRGKLDAGSVSCWLLLRAMAQAAQSLLKETETHEV